MWPWILGGLSVLALAVFVIAYICYRMAFYADRKTTAQDMGLLKGEQFTPYREQMGIWRQQTREMPCRELFVTSFDGLRLRGRLYVYRPDAPVEILFHGYRGSAERDLCGAVQRCSALGHSALIVDQRGGGSSQGRTITFGILERKDCLKWVELAIRELGPQVQILLAGISMGAATVLMAAGETLPANVVGVMADCGYSSPRQIIRKVIRGMGLPPALAYPFVRLGARLYGGFDLEETSPVEAMKTCRIPVLLIHGQEDTFVPWPMSREIFAACPTRKQLLVVPGAEHGMSYLVAPKEYLETMKAFYP